MLNSLKHFSENKKRTTYNNTTKMKSEMIWQGKEREVRLKGDAVRDRDRTKTVEFKIQK